MLQANPADTLWPQDGSRTSARLGMREKLSYGAGEMASNITWNMAAGFLLFYYSDVAMLPVAALGTLMLVTRVLDAVFDPLAGLIVDRTRTRYGKARPYLLYVPIPFAILTVLTFSVPDISATGKLVYAYITFAMMGLAYSLVYIPYSALLPLIARDPEDRVQLGSFRSMGTSIASILVYGLTMPIVAYVGGADKQLGFTVAAIIMAVTTAAFYFLTFANCRERYGRVQDPSDRLPLGTALRQMWANPVWRLASGLGLLIFVRLGIMVSCAAYFAKMVLGGTEILSIMLPSLSVGILAGGFVAGIILRRVAIRRANAWAGLATILCYLALPFFEEEALPFVLIFALANVATGIHSTSLFVMLANSVERHEELFGTRREGLLVSGASFAVKVGMALGAGIVAFALAAADYDPAFVTDTARTGVRHLFYSAPIFLTALLILGFLRDNENRVPTS
jgi:sugar (glycoside-pentoside-hexuronide) transporter